MKLLIILLIISLNQFLTFDLFPRLSYDNKTLPKFRINLDSPVKERYKQILIAYKNQIKTYSYITSKFPYAFFTKFFYKNLINKKFQDPEWYEYIEAVSEYSGISLNEAVMLSVTYDIACTTVVVQDEKGKVFMGRNLDFSTYFVIAHLMYEAEYYRKNQIVYKGIELAGFRGGINGVKQGKFSISLNHRSAGDFRLWNLYRIYIGNYTPNFYLMKVLNEAESYEDAFNMLKKIQLSAPVYYILSGIQKNEGVVLTRDWDGLYRKDLLDVDAGKWYIVITNTDLDKEEDRKDWRRVPTEKNIQKISRNAINYENLFKDVMSIFPANNLITAYTSIQAAGDGYFNTTMWIP